MSLNITRPTIHFTPPSGWMNDPNGLVYYRGEYHLFYQHNPNSIEWGDIHWGHAVSTDLAHWQHLPEALYPDELGTIWSGSIVADDNNTSGLLPDGGLVAIFTHSPQVQSLAYSSDNGRTWMKYAGNPVIPNDGSKDFRDPKVFWYAPGNVWVMTIAVGTNIRFYTSPNLIDWTQTGSFDDPDHANDSVWECPDLLYFDTPDGQRKWVLYFCMSEGGAPVGGSGICYYIGNFDGRTFTGDAGKRLWTDAGKDNYAGTSWSNLADNRRLFIGWLTNQRYSGLIPATTWRGTMTLPREWSLRQTSAGWRLAQKPPRELEVLRTTSQPISETRISENQPLVLGNVENAIELTLKLQIGSAAECGLRLSNSAGQAVTLGVHRQEGIFLDRSASGGFDNADFLQRHSVALDNFDAVELRVFIDTTAIEIFINDGEAVLSELLFMDAANRQLGLYATGGEALISEGKLYQLESMYQTKP